MIYWYIVHITFRNIHFHTSTQNCLKIRRWKMCLWKLCLPSTRSAILMKVMMSGTSSKIYLRKLFPPRSLGISSNPSGWKTLQASKRLSSRHLQLFHNYSFSLSQRKMSKFLFSSVIIPKQNNDNHWSQLTSLITIDITAPSDVITSSSNHHCNNDDPT